MTPTGYIAHVLSRKCFSLKICQVKLKEKIEISEPRKKIQKKKEKERDQRFVFSEAHAYWDRISSKFLALYKLEEFNHFKIKILQIFAGFDRQSWSLYVNSTFNYFF